MHFISEIFKDCLSDWVHERFVRYGRGNFEGPKVSVKKSNNSLKIDATVDYATVLGEIIATNSSENINLKGNVVAKREIEPLLKDIVDIKKSSGKKEFYSVEISGSLPADRLLELYKDIPYAHFLLDLKSDKGKLSCKKKLPKPSSKIDDKFCSADLDISSLRDVINELLFDVVDSDFKEVRVSHKYIIDELVAPEDLKKDPVRFRVEAKRKGKIIRTIEVDGSRTSKEHDLLV